MSSSCFRADGTRFAAPNYSSRQHFGPNGSYGRIYAPHMKASTSLHQKIKIYKETCEGNRIECTMRFLSQTSSLSYLAHYMRLFMDIRENVLHVQLSLRILLIKFSLKIPEIIFMHWLLFIVTEAFSLYVNAEAREVFGQSKSYKVSVSFHRG